MAILDVVWTLTDDESTALDLLIRDAGSVETRAEFVTRLGLKTLRSDLAQLQAEVFQANLAIVLGYFRLATVENQTTALTALGLERVGFAIRPIQP